MIWIFIWCLCCKLLIRLFLHFTNVAVCFHSPPGSNIKYNGTDPRKQLADLFQPFFDLFKHVFTVKVCLHRPRIISFVFLWLSREENAAVYSSCGHDGKAEPVSMSDCQIVFFQNGVFTFDLAEIMSVLVEILKVRFWPHIHRPKKPNLTSKISQITNTKKKHQFQQTLCCKFETISKI